MNEFDFYDYKQFEIRPWSFLNKAPILWDQHILVISSEDFIIIFQKYSQNVLRIINNKVRILQHIPSQNVQGINP